MRFLHVIILAPVLAGQSFVAERDETEAKILSAMHTFNLIAVSAGQLAQVKGTKAEIRNLGNLFVRDHTDLDRRVRLLAETQGIQLTEPTGSETISSELTRLKSLEGLSFDQAFVEFYGDAHRALSQELVQAQPQLRLPAVRALVAKLLPILRQHEFLCDWCWHHCLNHR